MTAVSQLHRTTVHSIKCHRQLSKGECVGYQVKFVWLVRHVVQMRESASQVLTMK